MTEVNDEQLDAMLRGHLAGELNPQLGRTERAFAQRLAEEAVYGPDAGPFPIRPRPRLFNGRTLSLIGTAMAAAVAAIVVGPAFMPQRQPVGTWNSTGIQPQSVDALPGQNMGRPPEGPPTLRSTHRRTLDEGTVIIGDEPARQLRHQGLRRIEWYDAETKARMELVVPREDVTHMKMDTY